MKHSGKSLVCALGGLVCCANAHAAAADPPGTPYQGIVDRNLFGLKPLPPPPSTTPEPPPAPKVTLTGLTTILGKKQVLMKLQMPTKPPEQPKEQSLILAEGEREGEIEVVSVDMQTGTVKLNDYGTPLTLNLEKDGAKLPATPAVGPGGTPGVPAAGGGANPFQPGVGGVPQNPGMKSLPTRTLRVPPAPGAGAPAPGAAAGVAPSTGLTLNPGIPSQVSPSGFKNWPPDNPTTSEEQAIIIEAQRELNKNNPNAPPLPITPLTPVQSTPSPAANRAGQPVFPPPSRPPWPQ